MEERPGNRKRSCPRQPDYEGGARPGLALAADGTSVGLQNLARDRQAQPGSTFLGRKKRLEDSLLDVAAHPAARIGEDDLRRSIHRARGDQQLATSIHRLSTVAQQV